MPRIRSATDVGQIVRAARRRRRMTQSDLAMAAGVSRRWIVDLEAGKPRAEFALILAVLDALGTPLIAETAEAPAVTHAAGSTAGVDLDDHLTRLAGND